MDELITHRRDRWRLLDKDRPVDECTWWDALVSVSIWTAQVEHPCVEGSPSDIFHRHADSSGDKGQHRLQNVERPPKLRDLFDEKEKRRSLDMNMPRGNMDIMRSLAAVLHHAATLRQPARLTARC